MVSVYIYHHEKIRYVQMGPRQMKSLNHQRDLDIRDRLELVTRGPSAGRVRNVTCVMQELGYIDHTLEPNYEQIKQRISNLPVSAALKSDIHDGLQFCQKFSVRASSNFHKDSTGPLPFFKE